MSFPTYHQDFEGGTTLGTACPELTPDVPADWSIDTSGSNAFTGTHALVQTDFTTSHDLLGTVNDLLGGDVTISCYFKNMVSNPATAYLYGRLSSDNTNYIRAGFATNLGLELRQCLAGVATTLNVPLSATGFPPGVWFCLELRCHGAAISIRVVRQDAGAFNGQFFVNTGSGSWQIGPPAYDSTNSGTATLTEAAGRFGLSMGYGNAGQFAYADDLIYEPAVPLIDHPTATLSPVGATQQLTAGGFTDPLFGVTWGSSDATVATVDSTGLVTAVAAGTATITATGKRDSGQTATSAVTVGSISGEGTTSNYLASVMGFAAGLVGTVEFKVLDSTGATYAAPTTSGVFAVGTVGYAVLATVPATGQSIVLWDDGSGHQAFEVTPAASAGAGGDPWATDLAAGGYTGTQAGALAATAFLPDGVIAAATSTTITLPATDSRGNALPTDGSYANTCLFIVEGTGRDQYPILGTFVSGLKYNVVAGTMPVTLDNTSQYLINGVLGNAYNADGVIASATATTVTLPAASMSGNAIPDDGRYADTVLRIVGYTGQGQVVVLTTQVSAAPRKYNVLAGTMPVQLDSTSQFQLAGSAATSISDKTGFSLAATGLDLIPATDPGGVATTFPQMVVALWRLWFKRSVKDTTTIRTYADNGSTVRTTQQITDDGAGNQTRSAAT